MAEKPDKEKPLQEFLVKLGLEPFMTSKLTLRRVLYIGPNTCKKIEPLPLNNVPWYFLQKVMALNGTARSIKSEDTEVNDDAKEFNVDDLFKADVDISKSVNPADVVCALLHCSDNFLQQEIISKMSMCQFAIPMLLPDGDGTGCTFMLWAMRDIVKRWRPQILAESKGFAEESLVNISLQLFSFVRLGVYSLSKSKILNHILSHDEQHHEYFVHESMSGGNVRRVISNGLVEMACFFPAGEDSDLYPEPIAVANLRGDLQCHKKQFNFLTKVSSTVFVFIENTEEKSTCFKDIEVSNLSYFFIISLTSSSIITGAFKTFLEELSCSNNNNYLFIISKSDNDAIAKETIQYLATLFPNFRNSLLPLKQKQPQDRPIAKKLQSLIKVKISKGKQNILDRMSDVAEKLGIEVDENSQVCKKTRTFAHDITKYINNVSDYKKHTMKKQGDLWSKLAKIEKEMCRMRKQGNMCGQDYRSQLIKTIFNLRKQQSEQTLSDSIQKFQTVLSDLSKDERLYFLRWMRVCLDSISRKNMSQLQAQPPIKSKTVGEAISEGNLGIEHFMREIGQCYESECFMCQYGEMYINQKRFNNLPGIAADLLLDGFPLELIDGDVSNIPLMWISEVLTELDNKTGGKYRMRVITVLGVQSTGKSTLLNTMFGLQFPVASGRCTRGAFMTMIHVEESLREELGYDFILVIDTEGLKAPELASLDNSSEHDNELATLVVGLSDITIINVSMESTSEMKEILQIVAHAFLRMKKIGKKPNCQFVHQNVSDPSAYEQNLREKKILLEQLDEMTKAAAKMEGYTDVTKLSDIIDYDIERHNWYVPGLWHGVPPMASISTGYSIKISEMKKYLLDILKKKTHSGSCSIKEFIEWIKSLWNAVKHEKFLFSFRNSLVADAYNELCIEYSSLEWNFRKNVHNWMTEKQNQIRNQLSAKYDTEFWLSLKNGINELLQGQVQTMKESLERYFESDNKHVKLVEGYREDFMRSASHLERELEYHLNNKCREVIAIQEEIKKINDIQGNYQKMIEKQVENLLMNFRDKQLNVDDKGLEAEFEKLWNCTLQPYNIISLEKLDISQLMLEHLRKEMKNKAGYVNEELINLQNLDKYQTEVFEMKKEYLEGSKFTVSRKRFEPEFWNGATAIVLTIIDRCHRYVTYKVSTKENYSEIFCQHLLELVNRGLAENMEKFQFKQFLEQDLKLLVLGKAAPLFQKMHDDFTKKNDLNQRLEKLKPEYFQTFKQVYQEKDDSKQRAQRFCEICLKPALSEYVYSNLGKDMVDEILNSEDSRRYGSRTFFQAALLNDLMTETNFEEYVKYCLQYEIFTKDWITKYIIERYRRPGSLNNLISISLTAITKKVTHVLEEDSLLQHTELSQSLNAFCESLQKDLVISQNDLNVVLFQNTGNAQQFFQYGKYFLNDLEEEIQNEIMSLDIESVLSRIAVKPPIELFKKVFGCGKQCPFCKVPCEAGGADHRDHFSAIHRPHGLGRYRDFHTHILAHELCTTEVVGNKMFICADTNWEPHPYKDYQKIYPDWKIQPDPSIEASLYWKYIFKEFNEEFAKEYKAKPANLPKDWYKITREQALQSLEKH